MMRNAQPFRSRRTLLSVAGLALLILGAVSPGHAQIVDAPCEFCPDPVVEVTTDTRLVQLSWIAAPPDVGRRVSNIEEIFFADSLGISANVEILGEYAGDCDLRLILSKVPVDPGLDRLLQLIYRLTDNVSGTGGDLARDTVDVPLSGVIYDLDPAIVGNLAVRVSSNIDAPPGPLGTIPMTVTGVNTTLGESTTYFVTALNSVSSLSEGLQIEATGPTSAGVNAPTRTFTVTSPAEAFPVMDGMTLAFGEGSVAAGDSLFWDAHYLFPSSGRIQADLEAFDGYRVWRSELPDVNEFALLGEIRPCESSHEIILLSEDEVSEIDIELEYFPAERRFRLSDRDLHNEFPYRYAVSTFDRDFLGNPEGITYEGNLAITEKLYPALASRRRASEVVVLPNPYRGNADWEEGAGKVVFTNLPTEATIRLFSVAADHVATIEHGPRGSQTTSATSAFWDLRSDVGSQVAAGIYIFYIEGTNQYDMPLDGGGNQTVSEPFQQTGKVVIIR